MKGESMEYTQKDFQEWIFLIDDKMEQFTNKFAGKNRLILDYTLASLNDLERWILNNYSDSNELIKDSSTLDYLTIYIGETFRKYIGGKWVIDLKNKRNAYYAMPTLTDSSCRGVTYIAPMAYATACISRNKGNHISGILMNYFANQIKTIDKLVDFMEIECYSFNSFSIGKYKAWEGLFLERDGYNYVYGYTERGHKDIERRFDSEEKAVRYVFEQISKGNIDNSHLVALTLDNKEILEAENTLKEMFIPFIRNDVPCFEQDGKTSYRIFVFGKNIRYLDDFKSRYCEHIVGNGVF